MACKFAGGGGIEFQFAIDAGLDNKPSLQLNGEILYFRKLFYGRETAKAVAIADNLTCTVGGYAWHFLQSGGVDGVEVEVGEFRELFLTGEGRALGGIGRSIGHSN